MMFGVCFAPLARRHRQNLGLVLLNRPCLTALTGRLQCAHKIDDAIVLTYIRNSWGTRQRQFLPMPLQIKDDRWPNNLSQGTGMHSRMSRIPWRFALSTIPRHLVLHAARFLN
jgi:hypothetical protein